MVSGGEHVEYTIQKLAQLAGISTRTLRYYDEIGILKPARINSSGYRIYGQEEVTLQCGSFFVLTIGQIPAIKPQLHCNEIVYCNISQPNIYYITTVMH